MPLRPPSEIASLIDEAAHVFAKLKRDVGGARPPVGHAHWLSRLMPLGGLSDCVHSHYPSGLPDWQDGEPYSVLHSLDRAGLMWEWLRRDPNYRDAWKRGERSELFRFGNHFP